MSSSPDPPSRSRPRAHSRAPSCDLELTFDNGTLAIAGKRGEQTYRYNVAVGDTIDPDAIEAKLDKGVLTVHAHKHPEAKPRKILVATPDKALDSCESK